MWRRVGGLNWSSEGSVTVAGVHTAAIAQVVQEVEAAALEIPAPGLTRALLLPLPKVEQRLLREVLAQRPIGRQLERTPPQGLARFLLINSHKSPALPDFDATSPADGKSARPNRASHYLENRILRGRLRKPLQRCSSFSDRKKLRSCNDPRAALESGSGCCHWTGGRWTGS